MKLPAIHMSAPSVCNAAILTNKWFAYNNPQFAWIYCMSIVNVFQLTCKSFRIKKKKTRLCCTSGATSHKPNKQSIISIFTNQTYVQVATVLVTNIYWNEIWFLNTCNQKKTSKHISILLLATVVLIVSMLCSFAKNFTYGSNKKAKMV